MSEVSVVMRAGVGVLGLSCAVAAGQPGIPAAFVANNGNLRGSVSSFIVQPDASLTFVQELVLANIPSGSDPGTNAYACALTPGGRFLAVSHATSAGVTERISMVLVNADATLSLAANFTTPDSPLALVWVSDALLAVTRTRSSGTNEIILYRFDESAMTLTEVDRDASGGFTSALAISPDRRLLVCNNSPLGGGASLRSFLVDEAAATLTEVGPFATGTGYALGQCFSVDGRFVYCGSGASGSQGMIGGLAVGDSGVLDPIPGAPFLDAGASPKQCVAAPGGEFLFVGHGTDSTIRVHSIEPSTGVLSDQEMVYDVGIQGSLGDIAAETIIWGDTLRDVLFFTDKETYDSTPRGLFSARINLDGSISVISTRIDTRGIAPNDIAVWRGVGGGPHSCDPDVNCDGVPDQDDVACIILAVAGEMTCFCQENPDFNRDGASDQGDVADVILVVAGSPCP